MLANKIIEAYEKYRQNVMEGFENPKNLSVALLITPKAFCELRCEERIFNDNFMFYIYLCGRKTPIVIREDLPRNVEFILQSRKDFEREETKVLYEKFYKMFEN